MKEIINHEVTIQLTTDGRLPDTIVCPVCSCPSKRKRFRFKPTYKCVICDAEVIFQLSKEQKARGLK